VVNRVALFIQNVTGMSRDVQCPQDYHSTTSRAPARSSVQEKCVQVFVFRKKTTAEYAAPKARGESCNAVVIKALHKHFS
jgi:hypothetical protein